MARAMPSDKPLPFNPPRLADLGMKPYTPRSIEKKEETQVPEAKPRAKKGSMKLIHRRVRQLHKSGLKAKEIISALKQEGLDHPTGKDLSVNYIGAMIRRPLYKRRASQTKTTRLKTKRDDVTKQEPSRGKFPMPPSFKGNAVKLPDDKTPVGKTLLEIASVIADSVMSDETKAMVISMLAKRFER